MKININEVSYIKIVAKRWFRKSCGNTYHSCAVHAASGELIGYKPFTYGYGTHYLNTAAKILGMEETELRSLIYEYPDKFFINCQDVLRKKDL